MAQPKQNRNKKKEERLTSMTDRLTFMPEVQLCGNSSIEATETNTHGTDM